MKNYLYVFFIALIIHFGISGCTGENSGGGTTLKTETVEEPPEENPAPIHGLFSQEPGTLVQISALSGSVDAVGTNIVDDFDGDGLINDDEDTSNVWVADYPAIGTSISTPVTMQIEILYANETSSKSIATDIMSEDVESTKEESADKIHRQEINERTVQYQDRVVTSSSNSASIGASRIDGFRRGRISANIKTAGIGNIRTKNTTSISASYSNSHDETKTYWKDQPFKNNVDANSWTQKDNVKSKKAKQLRREYREIVDTTKKIKPNAGYVRAALYITNNTVNMPVKLSNMLCSLMLEDNFGRLLPVQSFRLRNDDYSMFELDLYGDTTFGPYVIELEGLNTLEIKNAITKGYNPRIFLVDYDMTHVADSNYRKALSSRFAGNNLKIIEENAKGRTAGIKLVYPGERQFFRVSAFDTDGIESRTGSQGITTFSPGVSLEKALNRISYSGVDIKYADVVIDTTGVEPLMSIPRFHVRVVKSINGVEMKFPFPVVDSVPYKTVVGNHVDKDGVALGGSSTAYLMKPVDEWTYEEIKAFKMWAVFENGRYYLHTEDVLRTGDVSTYFEYQIPGQDVARVPMVKGVQSMIWPGDHYDIVCLEYKEQEEEQPDLPSEEKPFGTNPFETGESISFNTKWNLDSIEQFPFQPDAGSAYLGEAILGDTIEFNIKLSETRYLNPSFGEAESVGGKRIYKAFSYDLDRSAVSRKFEIDEAIDFEISFGLGGHYKHWTNLVDPIFRSPSSIYPLDVSDRNWNYLDQEFTIRIPIPMDLDGVGPDGTVKVFIRPARNNAYRESVWPLPYDEVKQFRGKLSKKVAEGESQLEITDVVGSASIGDTIYLDGYGYEINASTIQDGKTIVTLTTTTLSANPTGTNVFVNLTNPLTEPIIQIEVDDGFEAAWNLENPDSSTDNGDAFKPLTEVNQDPYSPANYLGYSHDMLETNWVGYNNYSNPYWNQWTDASNVKSDLKDFKLKLTAASKNFSLEFTQFDSDYLKVGSELMLSSTNQSRQDFLEIAVFETTALAVWSSQDSGNWDIRGQVINLADGSEGQPIGNEILISTSNQGSQISAKVAVVGTKAIVVWGSGDNGSDDDIRGQIIDLSPGSEGTKVGNELLISTSAGLIQREPKIATTENKALIVWQTLHPTVSNRDIHAQVLDMSPGFEGNKLGGEIAVSTVSNKDEEHPEVTIAGNIAVVVFEYGIFNQVDSEVMGQAVNLASGHEGELVGSAIAINSVTAGSQGVPMIVSTDDSALVIWYSKSSSTPNLKGRIIDAREGSVGSLISGEFPINTSSGNELSYYDIKISNEKAMIAWYSHDGSHGRIKGQIIGMSLNNEGEKIGPEIAIDDRAGFRLRPKIPAFGDKVLIVYESMYTGIEGRILDMSKGCEGKIIGSPILIKPKINNESGPMVSTSNGKSLVGWVSYNGTDHDIKGQVVDLNMLTNLENYFNAPLVERNFEVKAEILEE